MMLSVLRASFDLDQASCGIFYKFAGILARSKARVREFMRDVSHREEGIYPIVRLEA